MSNKLNEARIREIAKKCAEVVQRYSFAGRAILVERAIRQALSEQPGFAQGIEAFVVKHYSEDERPTIKGNGFDGLEIGTDLEEAEQFISFVNHAIQCDRSPAEPGMVSVPKALADALREWTGAEPSQSVLSRAVDDWLAAAKPGSGK